MSNLRDTIKLVTRVYIAVGLAILAVTLAIGIAIGGAL